MGGVMPDELLPATFLFRYSVPCQYRAEGWSKSDLDLGEEFRLPSFAALDGGPEGPDVRAAWNESGLMFSVVVAGKRQPPWCRENRLDESDGLNLWIDTRDTHNIHRAGRFCHHFLFMPSGGGHRLNEATGAMLAINRAREAARPVRGETLGAQKSETAGRLSAGRFRPGHGTHGLRSSRTSPAGVHVRARGSRTGHANLLLRVRVSLQRGPEPLGYARTSEAVTNEQQTPRENATATCALLRGG